jgi:hypothetical protein
MSLLQKPLPYKGDPAETAPTLNLKLWVLVVRGGGGGGGELPLLSHILFSNLFEESIKNLAPPSCGGATRTIATSMPSHACPGRAAGGPRRGLVPQAPTVQTWVSGGAPAEMLWPATRTRRRYIAFRANLPLYQESRIY